MTYEYMEPHKRINVFISSICGDHGRYDYVRAELKSKLENTGLANVYLFEATPSSTISAGQHYELELRDCDLCIFLIDNQEGIRPGVQKEIDIVKKYNIKALYYFCDGTSKEMTSLQKSLSGPEHAKAFTVHDFYDLVKDGAQGFIDDVTMIYRNYSRGRLVLKDEEVIRSQSIDISEIDHVSKPVIPKTIFINIDKSRDYILELIFGKSVYVHKNEEEKTCELDKWCVKFMSVVFGQKDISDFNMDMFLKVLGKAQAAEYHELVKLRWNAIQGYYSGQITQSLHNLKEALVYAREHRQEDWIISDILIDLRNLQMIYDDSVNQFRSNNLAQEELNNIEEKIYYPLMDRFNESIGEKYIDSFFKDSYKSPFTVTYGNGFNEYGSLLASSFIVALYNGSLTHILRFPGKIKELLFFLYQKYGEWYTQKGLLKFSIIDRKINEVKGIIKLFCNYYKKV